MAFEQQLRQHGWIEGRTIGAARNWLRSDRSPQLQVIQAHDAYWHKADIETTLRNVRFWVNSGHDD
jgi:hypothetical protein